MTKYSFIYPIRNRADLLLRGLQGLENLDYDKDLYEVVIADYMSEDHIIDVIHKFRGKLNIKYLCIDHRRYKQHKINFKSRQCNPALAQNLAVSDAEGKFIILTSPEVIHWRYNLKKLDEIEDLDKKFIYGRVIEKTETDFFGNDKKFPFETINKLDSHMILCDWSTKGKTVALYFIGVISREKFMKYGGIDEYYMGGIAYEDADFGYRMDNTKDIILEFDDNICGVHLSHDRSYQDVEGTESNRIYLDQKQKSGLENHLVANTGIHFADPDVLIERLRIWRF